MDIIQHGQNLDISAKDSCTEIVLILKPILDILAFYYMDPRSYLSLLQKVRDGLKTDPVLLEICQKYSEDPEVLDLVPIKFDNIDVSARTDHGVITLNTKLLNADDPIAEIKRYLIHELQHWAAQSHASTPSAEEGDYLSNPEEQKAFQYQAEYIADHDGEEEAEDYIDQVLDYHQEEGRERKEKRDILLKKVESFHHRCRRF